TAAAAIAVARNRMSLSGCTATVLGATGPVGIRAAQLLASEKAKVRVVSRTMDRAIAVCRTIEQSSGNQCTEPTVAATAEEFESVCRGSDRVVAAGAAGVSFLPEGALSQLSGLKMAIDLNAVPPAGIAEIGVMDRGTEKNGVLCYGALGVGGLKMKVHKQSVRKLFESSQQVIDLTEIYQLALAIDKG
ncbi:MAG: bifunctional NADP-dependent methylenetetrahydromethanopterin dehydrogenase/methylenetetrahydrofolate dehydrogenase, partial [Planctomyces sp.]